MKIGEVYGRWTIVAGGKPGYWLCRCSCGTERLVYGRSLEQGDSRSCGCLRKQLQKESARDLTGERFGKLLVLRRDPGRDSYWICRCDCGKEKSIRGTSLTKKGGTRSCGCDQRKIASEWGAQSIAEHSKAQIELNRRLHTNTQVIRTKTPPKNNRSGMKGIWWNEKRGQWEAFIQVHGSKIHLGRYAKREDAVKARLVAEEKYFEPLLAEVGE